MWCSAISQTLLHALKEGITFYRARKPELHKQKRFSMPLELVDMFTLHEYACFHDTLQLTASLLEIHSPHCPAQGRGSPWGTVLPLSSWCLQQANRFLKFWPGNVSLGSCGEGTAPVVPAGPSSQLAAVKCAHTALGHFGKFSFSLCNAFQPHFFGGDYLSRTSNQFK